MWELFRPDAAAVTKDANVKSSLNRYFSVIQNEKPAKFLITKKLPALFSKSDSLEELWRVHRDLTEVFFETQAEIDANPERLQQAQTPCKSFLDLKIEIANRILRNCRFCPRKCGIDRSNGVLGYCKCGKDIVVSSIFCHMGEEPELVPSGTIFTMGCTMKCKHCQNWTISQWTENGQVYKTEELAVEIERLRVEGCRNVNLVGGEPTPWLCQWLETFSHVSVNIPIVWNSNSYYSSETAQLLAGFADVYLLDFKYGSGECAERISDAPDYWKACTCSHVEANRYGELIVRVLVLPDHVECCTRPIINWIANNIGRKTRVNLMFQYRPEWRASEIPEMCRKLTNREIEQAIRSAHEARLENLVT